MSIHVSPQGATVLSWWREMTGQEIRVPNFLHGRQCQTIVETYTREDVELTVRYMKAEISANEANGRKGLNARSLTWANFFGPDEECSKFADNWNQARAAMKKRSPKVVPVVASEKPETLYSEGAEKMKELMNHLKGRKNVSSESCSLDPKPKPL